MMVRVLLKGRAKSEEEAAEEEEEEVPYDCDEETGYCVQPDEEIVMDASPLVQRVLKMLTREMIWRMTRQMGGANQIAVELWTVISRTVEKKTEGLPWHSWATRGRPFAKASWLPKRHRLAEIWFWVLDAQEERSIEQCSTFVSTVEALQAQSGSRANPSSLLNTLQGGEINF